MAFEYQGFATLGVNLNRQKYGPLDVSTVFTSVADLTYYISKGSVKMEGLSDYWNAIIPYPYAGQIVALVVNKDVSVYKLVENAEGLYENYILHHWQTIDASPLVNAVAFVVPEE